MAEDDASVPLTLSSGRKKPHCRFCGMPMYGHKKQICPSEEVAYNDSPLPPDISGTPPASRTSRARTRRATTAVRRAQSHPRRRKTTDAWIESVNASERMPCSIAPDNEMMHSMPRMVTWFQLAFSGAVGGLVVLLAFILWALYSACVEVTEQQSQMDE